MADTTKEHYEEITIAVNSSSNKKHQHEIVSVENVRKERGKMAQFLMKWDCGQVLWEDAAGVYEDSHSKVEEYSIMERKPLATLEMGNEVYDLVAEIKRNESEGKEEGATKPRSKPESDAAPVEQVLEKTYMEERLMKSPSRTTSPNREVRDARLRNKDCVSSHDSVACFCKEEDSRYADPNQRRHGIPCMKCGRSFSNKNTINGRELGTGKNDCMSVFFQTLLES
jgi:hypothetical protein